MRRMLSDRLAALQSGPRGAPDARARWLAARTWIGSRSRADLFDFETICDWLALDAEHVRAVSTGRRTRSVA